MLPRDRVHVALLSVAALCAAWRADAACLVLQDGTALEVRTAPERRSGLAVFQDRNGHLVSMPAEGIDAAATAAANRGGVCVAVAGGRVRGRQPLASPLRDTARPIVIQGPSGVGPHVPDAREIGAAMSATASSAGKPIGPPRGFSMDCSVVECGKKQHDVVPARPVKAGRPGPDQVAAGRGGSEGAESPGPSSPAAAVGPAASTRRALFGQGFHSGERAEEPTPAPAPAPRKGSQRKSHRG